jgi:nitrate reductase gamma subunit
MMTLIIFYGSIAFCLTALLAQLIRFIKAPVHLRWEIYREDYSPTTSGDNERYPHGCYRKIKTIVPDVLLLRGYYQQRRFYWIFLYMFHLGIYTLFLWHIYLFAIPLSGRSINSEWALMWGHSSTGLAFIGALGILILRITVKEMRTCYPAIGYFKWIFILASLAGGFLAVFFHFGNSITDVIVYVDRQLDFDWAYKLNSPLMPSLHVLVASMWLIYLPFSHVMKLAFRYYHELRWDFVRNTGRGRLARAMEKNLARPVSWSAVHVNPDQSWATLIASSARVSEDKR